MARQSKTQQRARRKAELERKRKEEARRKAIRNVGIAGAAVFAVVVLVVAIWPAPDVGDTSAEAWDLPQLDGEGRVALADFRGKPTVAAFFASWCEVCEWEIPQYLAVSREVGDEINFVGINTQDNGAGMGDARKWGIAGAWPLARDIGNGNGSGLSVQTFFARGMPLTVIYDEDGREVFRRNGGVAGAELISILESAGLYST